MTTQTSITPEQEKQYLRFVEDAARKALKEVGPDKDGIQKLIGHGGEFQARIVAAVREFSLSNQYADEERESSYGYLSSYKPQLIAEQVEHLQKLFPNLGSADEQIVRQRPPSNAEGWFTIPRWELIAPTYGEAVQKVLDLIKQAQDGKLDNYREGHLDPNRLRQHERTVAMFQKLGDQQTGHDILMVPAQFGLHYRGRSIRRAREVFNTSEFGLGAFAIGIMLLTHPERLQHYDDLWIDCAGDEYSPGADGQFDSAPYFVFNVGRVVFVTRWVDFAHGHYGSASAFLPQ